MNPFTERIHSIYDRHAPKQIHPLIGRAFETPSTSEFRIMAVGINSYVSAADEGKEHPGWFAGWFRDQSYRYQRGAWRDLKALGEALTRSPLRFASKTFLGMESLYVTNAIKAFVPEASGKRADQLGDADYERHLDQWHDELDVMAEHDALPHVIAIIGAPFWPFACSSFRKGAFKRMKTTSYEACAGPCRHFLNRIVVEAPRGEHDLLLVRLRHPAGRSRTGSPKWLLAQEEFGDLAADRT